MQKKLYESKYCCCGCTACYSICSVNAIFMSIDDEGFQYPRINQDLCVSCGKCEIVCPLKVQQKVSNPLHIYAAKNRNEFIRSKSSSGGVFSLLADFIESNDGVIYGAAFDEKYVVRHMRAETTMEWKKFCVSKYVQSDLNDVFLQIGEDLRNGRDVLFSGTPCQVDGLKQYLKHKSVSSDHLVTCDIVCHGTPSPLIWSEYLSYIQNVSGREIGFISFRDKDRLGWHNSTLTIKDKEQGTILSETQIENYFFQLFLCHEILRPACHQCRYSNFCRPGDVTLGDFWGIEKDFKQFDDDKGVSLVMVNTEVGEKIWKAIQKSAEYFEISQDQCIQPNLEMPSEEGLGRKRFWHWYKRYGFKRTGQSRGYLPMNFSEKVLKLVYLCVEKGLSLLGF